MSQNENALSSRQSTTTNLIHNLEPTAKVQKSFDSAKDEASSLEELVKVSLSAESANFDFDESVRNLAPEDLATLQKRKEVLEEEYGESLSNRDVLQSFYYEDAPASSEASTTDEDLPIVGKFDLIKKIMESDQNFPKKTIRALNIAPVNRTMYEAAMTPDLKFLYDRLITEGELGIYFGSSGSCKTIHAVQIAEKFARENPEKHAYHLDCELSGKQFQSRYTNEETGQRYSFADNFIRAEINVDGIEDSDLGKKFSDLIIASIEEVLEQDEKCTLFIVDNITYLFDDPEKSKDALGLMKRLKAIKNKYSERLLTMIVIAHTPKRDSAKPLTKNDLFGSSMLYNFAENVIAIGTSSKGADFRYIKQLKTRIGKADYDADNVLECVITQDSNGFVYLKETGTCPESEHLAGFTKESDWKSKAVEYFSKGMSQRQVAKELGKSPSTINAFAQGLNQNPEKTKENVESEELPF